MLDFVHQQYRWGSSDASHPDSSRYQSRTAAKLWYFHISSKQKNNGGSGELWLFFLGSPSPQDSFKRYMGFHGLQRWMNPNGPLDEFRFFLSTNVGGRYGDGIWTSKDGHIPLHFHHRWGFVFVSSSQQSFLGKVWFVGMTGYQLTGFSK